MNSFAVLLAVGMISVSVRAEVGLCGALGRVGGEDEICAQYDNTDEATCKKADGFAWCYWKAGEKDMTIGKGGGLNVQCTEGEGVQSKYSATSVESTPMDGNGLSQMKVNYVDASGVASSAVIPSSGHLCSVNAQVLLASCTDAAGKTTSYTPEGDRFDYEGLALFLTSTSGVFVNEQSCTLSAGQ